jgi:hypothetical protein
MLSNIIGTLLAFVTVMLMLSLIVTSLVQFTQATLRLRGRNLLVGVGALIEKHVPQETLANIDKSALRWNAHAAVAAHVLNEADAPAKWLKKPNSWGRVLLGPPISWVNSDDLARALVKTAAQPTSAGPAPIAVQAAATTLSKAAAAANQTPTAPATNNAPAPGGAVAPAAAGVAAAAAVRPEAAIAQAFKNMEPAISKRFQFIMRIWTVAFSFLIAFAFQLSTPELLKQLPSADAKRQAILAAVPALTNESTKALAFSEDNILEESLKRLAQKYPEYKDLFAEIAGIEDPNEGIADEKQGMLDEMRNVLGKRDNREQVLSDYSSIIDSLSQSSASTALANSSKLIEQLDSFGISPKLDNFEFYSSLTGAPASADGKKAWNRVIHWSNIVGVLITGILLSLGAPFWFDQLKNLSSLRDAMDPSAAAAKSK